MNVSKFLKKELDYNSKINLLLRSVFKVKKFELGSDKYLPMFLPYDIPNHSTFPSAYDYGDVLCSHLFKADGNSYTSVYGSEGSLNNMILEQFSRGLKCIKLMEEGKYGIRIPNKMKVTFSMSDYSVTTEHRPKIDEARVVCIDLDEFDGSDLHLEFLDKNLRKIRLEYYRGFEVNSEKPEYAQFRESLVDFFTGKVLSEVKTENIARYNELSREDKYDLFDNVFNKLYNFVPSNYYPDINSISLVKKFVSVNSSMKEEVGSLNVVSCLAGIAKVCKILEANSAYV